LFLIFRVRRTALEIEAARLLEPHISHTASTDPERTISVLMTALFISLYIITHRCCTSHERAVSQRCSTRVSRSFLLEVCEENEWVGRDEKIRTFLFATAE